MRPTIPTCTNHWCRYERPGLEARVTELWEELAEAREHAATLTVNAKVMFNALDYIARQSTDPKAQEIAADALHSLLTDVAA